MSDPTPLGIVLDEVRLVRADLAAYRRETAMFDAARCQQHTDRLHAIASRQDTYDASQAALHAERLRASDRGWRLWGAVVAVAMLSAAIVGLFVH